MAEENERKAFHPANDNGSCAAAPLDPRILRIAEIVSLDVV